MKWTPEARDVALHAQADYGDDVVDATIQRAEQIARENGYPMVDTDVWLSALLDVRMPGLDDKQTA